MSNEDKMQAELKALRSRVNLLTALTVILMIAVLALAIRLFGADGVVGIAIYVVLGLIAIIIPLVLFLKVCRFREQQMKGSDQ